MPIFLWFQSNSILKLILKGQEWSPYIINDRSSLNIGLVFDGNSTHDSWKLAYASPNNTIVVGTLNQGVTSLDTYNFTGTIVLAFEKFNGAYFLATTNQMVIREGALITKQRTIPTAGQIASVVTANYLHAVAVYNSGSANWVVYDTSFNIVYNQTLSVTSVSSAAIIENGNNMYIHMISHLIQ